jgi:hypothetical protein
MTRRAISKRPLVHTDIDPAVELPPHLLVLSPDQRLFVQKFVEIGSPGPAAAAAGLSGPNGMRDPARLGSDLMRVRKVREAILLEQIEHGHSLRSLALKVWREALTHHEPKVRLAAAKEIADRFGLVKVTKVEAEHTHQFSNMSESDLTAFIRERIEARKLIDITPESEVSAAQSEVMEGTATMDLRSAAHSLVHGDEEFVAAIDLIPPLEPPMAGTE